MDVVIADVLAGIGVEHLGLGDAGVTFGERLVILQGDGLPETAQLRRCLSAGVFEGFPRSAAGGGNRVGDGQGNLAAVEVDRAQQLGDPVRAEIALVSDGLQIADGDGASLSGYSAALPVAENQGGDVEGVQVGHEMAAVGQAVLEMIDLAPGVVPHRNGDGALGDDVAGQADALEWQPRRSEGLGAAHALPTRDVHREYASRDQAVLDRLEIRLAVTQQGAAGRPRRNGQILAERGGEPEAQRGGGGHRRIQPVADELAEVDDVLALAGRGQKGLRRLGVQVVGQHVAHAAEQIEQDDTEIGVIEIGPAVGELRDLRQQLLTDRFVILVDVSDACAAHGLSGFRRLCESA